MALTMQPLASAFTVSSASCPTEQQHYLWSLKLSTEQPIKTQQVTRTCTKPNFLQYSCAKQSEAQAEVWPVITIRRQTLYEDSQHISVHQNDTAHL